MAPIDKLLIANRAVIASRIIQTCRDLGIQTVAVHSDVDADLPFVRDADEAINIGAPMSYLDVEKILAAAERTGADAIHPGTGLLAENATFANAVRSAGLVFVGPSADAIAKMGTKREAKAFVQELGIPVVPGFDGIGRDGQSADIAQFAQEAERIGYPVLIKASAGGGGKGMRRVDSAAGFADAFASAARESSKAFGDDSLLLEKYLLGARHIEVQIFGDQHDNVVHLFERECSLQRRHQKVIEESPAPNLDTQHRDAMCDAAITVARAIRYESAGTVEFVLTPDGFYFLEMNTRLQVEVAVTESVLGLNLVAMQLDVAEGKALPSQDGFLQTGHAIEARVYAEDRAFLPQTGELLRCEWPRGKHVRVDGGYEQGNTLSVHYDPMIAKLIAWGPDRRRARRRLRYALEQTVIHGITHNTDVLLSILEQPEFVSGLLDTQFLSQVELEFGEEHQVLGVLCATLVWRQIQKEGQTRWRHVPPGFSNNPRPEVDQWNVGQRTLEVKDPGGSELTVDGRRYHARLHGFADGRAQLEVDGHRFTAVVTRDEGGHELVTSVTLLGETYRYTRQPRFPEIGTPTTEGGLHAPMPAIVAKVWVEPGTAVKEGQRLFTLEAMKMEHAILAPRDGVVEAVNVVAGEQVDSGQCLAELHP